jgi:hypothetical protein
VKPLEIQDAARALTGLDDFGPPDYLDGLRVLLDSYAHEAALTERGTRVARAMLRGALVARLVAQAAFLPDDVPVTRPIFVTGLPRTGTTALHRLLTADPAHQGLELWLTEVPQPRPPRSTWAENPIYAAIEEGCRRHRTSHPEFMGVHYVSADQVEECWQLLRQSMMSVSFECLAHLPGYSAWLWEQDWTPAYQRHRRNLQLIGRPDAGRRWVLKNPSHLFALDALLRVYPDALVIQTHRAPATAIASVCSLNAQASAGWSTVYQGRQLGRDQLDLWARGVDRFLAARSRHDPASFLDVHYASLVADPLAVVETVYERLGTPLSPEARSAMVAMHQASLSGERRPAHRYDLADFGLTRDQVDERFAGYLAMTSSANRRSASVLDARPAPNPTP